MANVLNEAFKVSRSKDLKNNPIAFIDPNLPENEKSYDYRDIISKSGAKWSKSPQFKYVFPPHSKGFWFWYIGATEDKWRNVYDKMIKPALEKIHGLEGASPEDSQASLISSLDGIIEKIATAQPSFDSTAVLTKEQKQEIVDKLEGFKTTLVNIKDDAQFKETLKKVMAFKNAQGHEFSFMNSILTLIQRPDAKVVKSKTNWLNLYNRKINEGAIPIWLRKPSERAKVQLSQTEKQRVTQEFLKSVGKNSVKELGAGQQEKLNIELGGRVVYKQFEFYDTYDYADTTLIEGKEDPIQAVIQREEIPWFEADKKDERVKPVYTALMDYANQKGIHVELKDEKTLGGSRGVSMGGKIFLLQNDGDDVGTTKTFAHELAHELLHQKYVKEKDKEMQQYFLGQEQGRQLVEQQAELTAWMVMAAFGFDLQTTSLNYVALWGADDKTMVNVFDKVSSVANYLIREIAARGNKLAEADIPMGKKQYTPFDVAKILGVESKFQDVVKQEQQMNEMLKRYKKLITK